VIQFIYGWNQYLWPLLITTQDSMQTIVTGIKKMLTTTDELAEWQLAMATAVLAMLPPVAVVVFMQRLFVRGPGRDRKIGQRWPTSPCATCTRPIPVASKPSRGSISRSATVSSASWSAPPAAASPRCCGWWRGLETITGGDIDIGGRIVNQIEPADRDIAMVFQNYALYPHMSVYNNMAYGLRNRGMPKPEIDTRVQEAARILEIGPMPRPQAAAAFRRTAPARRYGPGPRAAAESIFCSMSPCPTSTPSCASPCASKSGNCKRRLNTTSIYVTHDQLEAMTLADILVVMNGGQVDAIGKPARDLSEARDDLRRPRLSARRR